MVGHVSQKKLLTSLICIVTFAYVGLDSVDSRELLRKVAVTSLSYHTSQIICLSHDSAAAWRTATCLLRNTVTLRSWDFALPLAPQSCGQRGDTEFIPSFSTVRRSNLWFISLNPSHCRAAPHGWSQRSWTVIASCGTAPGANKQKPFGLRWGKKKREGEKNKKIRQHTLKSSGAYRHCFSFSFRQRNPERKNGVVS